MQNDWGVKSFQNLLRVNFMDPVLLESSTEVLKTMGVPSSSLDIEMPTYISSQSTLSQESRSDTPIFVANILTTKIFNLFLSGIPYLFDASDEDEQAARPRKRRRAAAKRYGTPKILHRAASDMVADSRRNLG